MSITNSDIAMQQAFRRQKKALFRRLQHNLFYKCTALLSAIGLFVFVQTERGFNPTLTRDIPVDIAYINAQVNLDTENLQKQAVVTVTGPAKITEGLQPGNIKVTADLANYTDDTDQQQIVYLKYGFRLPPDVAAQIHIERPLSIKITLFTIKKKEFNITVPDLPAPAGFHFGVPSTNPGTVTCRGRKAPVDLVDRVVPDLYAMTRLTHAANQTIQGTVALIPLDRDGNFVPGIIVEPRTVHLQLTLIEDLESRNVTVSVPIDPPPPPWTIGPGDIHVYPPLVKIKGLPSQLTPIYTISTERIVLTAESTSITQECTLVQPPGVYVYDLNGNPIRSVRVTINLHKAAPPAPAPIGTQNGTPSGGSANGGKTGND